MEVEENYRIQNIGAYKIRTLDLTDATSTPVGGTTNKTFTVPEGYILKIIGAYISIPTPTGGASGTHVLYIYPGSLSTNRGVMVQGAYNVIIGLAYQELRVSSTCIPNLIANFYSRLQDLVFNSGDTVKITYSNQTNVVADLSRVVEFQYILIPQLD